MMDNIQKEIFSIIKNQLHININEKSQSVLEKNIFSQEINFDAVNLIYFIILIERKLGFRFTEDDFDSSDFYTLKGMSNIIYSHLEA